MPPRKAARAATGFTPEEQSTLDRAEAVAKARLKAEGAVSILDQTWAEMDTVVGLLLSEWAGFDDDGEEDNSVLVHYGELRGQAQGLAYAISLMTQPYGDRDLDAVRAEAMRRQQVAPTRRRPSRRRS
jgi:hypothetical protein